MSAMALELRLARRRSTRRASRVYRAGGVKLNHWALVGDRTVEKQASLLNKANGRIAYCFHARDLHIVMGPAARGTTVRFRVLINGKPPGGCSRS